MKLALFFFLISGFLLWHALEASAAVTWLLVWAAVSCFLVGAAYAGLGPRLFGKDSSGRFVWWAILLLGPYLAAYQLLWHLVRVLSRESACHQVAPGVWLGRRPFASDLPSEVVRIVDLCVEFHGTTHRQKNCGYIAIPTLDAGLSDPSTFWKIVREISDDPHPVYIHCASGHGRSAMFAAALLVRRGLARDVDEAEALLKRARAGVHLNLRQREFVRKGLEAEPRCSNSPLPTESFS